MRIIRVVTHKDGETRKKPGETSTEIIEVNRRFAAEDIKDVFDKLPELLTENESLYAIIDENPIFIL